MVLLREIKADRIRIQSIRCIVLGLDNAGKSSVVAKLFNEDGRGVAPTVGFQIRTMQIDRVSIDFWDVGGQKTLRAFWSNYYHTTDALLWIVDSTDQSRLSLCRQELETVLREERLQGAEVLILANKQDVTGAVSIQTIAEVLNLSKIEKYRKCWIKACSAISDDASTLQHIVIEDFLNKTRQRLYHQNQDLHCSRSTLGGTATSEHVDWNEMSTKPCISKFGFESSTRARLFPQSNNAS